MTDIEKTLAEYRSVYGDLDECEIIATRLQETMRANHGWPNLSPDLAQELTRLSYKIARVLMRPGDGVENAAPQPQPQPDADGWIPWGGGECPVDANALVCARYRNGLTGKRPAELFQWRDNGFDYDIIAYKVVDHE